MGKVRSLGFALVAFGATLAIASSPSLAQSKFPKNAPPAQAVKAEPAIPILALPPFDRTTENYRLALEIVRISMPRDKQEKLMRTEMPPALEVAFGMDPDMAALEKEYPGLIAFVSTRFVDFIVERYMANFAYFEDASAIDFVNGLDLAELREYRAFLDTSAGQKLITFGYDFLSFDGEMLNQSIGNDDPEIVDAILTVKQDKVDEISDQFTIQDKKELMAFIQRPVFKKIARINAISSKSSMDSGLDQLLDEETIDRFIYDVMLDFIADQ